MIYLQDDVGRPNTEALSEDDVTADMEKTINGGSMVRLMMCCSISFLLNVLLFVFLWF